VTESCWSPIQIVKSFIALPCNGSDESNSETERKAPRKSEDWSERLNSSWASEMEPIKGLSQWGQSLSRHPGRLAGPEGHEGWTACPRNLHFPIASGFATHSRDAATAFAPSSTLPAVAVSTLDVSYSCSSTVSSRFVILALFAFRLPRFSCTLPLLRLPVRRASSVAEHRRPHVVLVPQNVESTPSVEDSLAQ